MLLKKAKSKRKKKNILYLILTGDDFDFWDSASLTVVTVDSSFFSKAFSNKFIVDA